MSNIYNHNIKGSPYKLLNELEQTIQNNYSVTILNMSKAIMTEINKKIKNLKKDEIL